MVDDGDPVDAELDGRLHQRSDGVVGGPGAGVAQDVRLTRRQAERPELVDAAVHAGQHREPAGREGPHVAAVEPGHVLGVALDQVFEVLHDGVRGSSPVMDRSSDRSSSRSRGRLRGTGRRSNDRGCRGPRRHPPPLRAGMAPFAHGRRARPDHELGLPAGRPRRTGRRTRGRLGDRSPRRHVGVLDHAAVAAEGDDAVLRRRRPGAGGPVAARPPEQPHPHARRLVVPVLRPRAGGRLVGPTGLAAGIGDRAGAGRPLPRDRALPRRDRQAGRRPGLAVHRPGPEQGPEHRGLGEPHLRHQPVERQDRRGVQQPRRPHPHLRHQARRERPGLQHQRAGRGVPVLHDPAVHLLPGGRRTALPAHDLLVPAPRPPARGPGQLGDRHPEDRRLHVLAAAARRASRRSSTTSRSW